MGWKDHLDGLWQKTWFRWGFCLLLPLLIMLILNSDPFFVPYMTGIEFLGGLLSFGKDGTVLFVASMIVLLASVHTPSLAMIMAFENGAINRLKGLVIYSVLAFPLYFLYVEIGLWYVCAFFSRCLSV